MVTRRAALESGASSGAPNASAGHVVPSHSPSSVTQRQPSSTIAWVGSHVLPHEAAVRTWLRRWVGKDQDIDDIIQEAYCRLAELDSVAHIANGRAYLFRTARNVFLEHLRHSRVVRIDNVMDMAALNLIDEAAQPERIVAGARELHRVQRLVSQLPTLCRQVFTLRRFHGISQRETARTLRISENAVEKQASRGLQLILEALESDDLAENSEAASHERSRNRTRSC